MLNLMELFTFLFRAKNDLFYANLVQKVKIVFLRWTLVFRLRDNWNYMPPILVPSFAKRIATQMLPSKHFNDVGQRQTTVETTLCISTLKCTTSNNVESRLRVSMLTWKTLDNVETTLSFSTSSFTKLINVETTLWKWPLPKRTKKHPEKFK